MKASRLFPAKVLLFGEYTVLSGSRALAIPFPQWIGQLTNNAIETDPDLKPLSQYVDQHRLFSSDGRAALRQAIEDGLSFTSTIPIGYGAGSSGALSAAVYDQFFAQHEADLEIPNIKKALASIEDHFHGTSSGMDPLVSYLQTPVLHESGSDHILQEMRWPQDLQIFLIDSGAARHTDGLVAQFKLWSEQDDFKINCLRPLVQSVDHAIGFFIDFHMPAFWEHLKLISSLQYQYFRPMITASVESIWHSLLEHPQVSIKLCGAGGGGFYLGFARDGFHVEDLLKDFGVQYIHQPH